MQSSYGQIGRIPASGLLAWAMAAMLIVGCGATGPKNQPAGELLPPADPPPAIDTDLAGLSGGHADPSSDPGDPTATGDPGETPSRIRVRTFDDLMKLKPEWIDPALGNLLMAYEAGYATREDVIEARAGIKRLVDAARQLVNLRDYHLLPPQERRRRDRANAVKIVETIVSMGFGFDKEDPDGHRPENLFLHHVLKRRRGYCVSLSLLTLSVAYYLNVPMHGVRAPGHLFVRFGSYSDVENDQRNFEMTDNGSERDNRHYMQRYSIHPQAIVNNAFLTNLDGRCVFSDVTSNLGSLCMLKDDVPKAIEWYRRAVALDPANPQAQYNLGTALARHNDPGGAIAAYREAIRLNPGDYFSLCARGQLYFENGDPTVGFEDVAAAISLRPRDPHGLVLRGVLYAKSDKPEQAEKDFRQALQNAPDDVAANRNLALLFARQNRADEARAQITRFLELAPADPDAARLKAYLDHINSGDGGGNTPPPGSR